MKALVVAEVLKLRSTRTSVWLLLATLALVPLTVTVTVPEVGAEHPPVPLDDPSLLAVTVGNAFGVPLVLKLLLQPAMRLLERWHVPRTIAALLVILAVFATIVGLGTAISGPAGTWAARLPEGIPRLQERLKFLAPPIETVQRFLQQAENFGKVAPPSPAVAAPAGG